MNRRTFFKMLTGVAAVAMMPVAAVRAALGGGGRRSTNYVNISASEIDPDSPVTSTLTDAIRKGNDVTRKQTSREMDE